MHKFKSGDKVRIVHPGSHLGRIATVVNSHNDLPIWFRTFLRIPEVKIVSVHIDNTTIGTLNFNYQDLINV